MDSTKLQGFVDQVFNTLKGMPIIRRLPGVLATLQAYHDKLTADIATVAGAIPAGATWQQIVDAIFAYLEGAAPLPWEKAVLEWLRVAVDALFTQTPPVNVP